MHALCALVSLSRLTKNTEYFKAADSLLVHYTKYNVFAADKMTESNFFFEYMQPTIGTFGFETEWIEYDAFARLLLTDLTTVCGCIGSISRIFSHEFRG